MPYFMLTTNGLMHVGNADEDAEDTLQQKVSDIVQPWTMAKTTKVQREAAVWICKAALPFASTENKHFRAMMGTSTNGAFTGPCSETIQNVSLHYLMLSLRF
jgi:hypothetical protein